MGPALQRRPREADLLEAPGHAAERFSTSADWDLSAARLLALPLLSTLDLEGAELRLLRVARRAPVYAAGRYEGLRGLSQVGFSLESWSYRLPTILEAMRERIPALGWLCNDELALRPAGQEAGWAHPISGWRRAAWQRNLEAERLWRASWVGASPDQQAENLTRASARVRFSAYDLALALDLDPDRDLVEALFQKARSNPEWAKPVARTISQAVHGLILCRVLPDSPASLSRKAVEKELEALRDPATVAASLEDPELRRQAQEEWREVLASPLSPVPWLEDALSRPWDELGLDEKSVRERFERQAQAILASPKKRKRSK